MFRLFFICILFFSQLTAAQKEASIWYFGQGAGLDFNSGSPVILSGGQIRTYEGVASIADANGKLLFYTDGQSVWNRQHNVMPNGTGLLGHPSSTQSAIIVPAISDPSRFWILTVAQLGGPGGLNFSMVDMSANNGLGDVTTKNTYLQLASVCEKLTAVRHCNGKDVWVVVHGFGNANFYSFLVTTAGILTAPVVSTVGMMVPSNDGEYAIGCMKISPDGSKIAAAHRRLGVDLLDFNSSTGVVSNSRPLFKPTEYYGATRGAYGVEFSPNSKYFYVAGDYYDWSTFKDASYLLQYDVSFNTLADIQASQKKIYQQDPHWWSDNFGTLQTGPDGKIYLAEHATDHLSVINSPDNDGLACDFVHAGLKIAENGQGGWSEYGLPTFIQSFFRNTFTMRGVCTGNLISFDYTKGGNETFVKWDFGDPASGAANISIQDSSQHLFSAAGNYTVKLIRFTSCGSDTITKIVSAGSIPVNLGNDTLLCGQTHYTITPTSASGSGTFLWQDGSGAASFNATSSGEYWLEITNPVNGCKNRDTINIKLNPVPVFSLGNDQVKCDGQTVNLAVNLPATYTWNTGAVTNNINVNQSGWYWVDALLNGCTARDSVSIEFNSYPVIDLGKDTTLCETTTLQLNTQHPGMQIMWQNNSSAPAYTVTTAGDYWVSINNKGCITRDTIKVKYLDKPSFTLGADTSICEGMSLTLVPRIIKGTDLSYQWNTGATANAVTVSSEGQYTLTLQNTCGTLSDAIYIGKGVCNLYIPKAFTPNRDGLNDVFKTFFGDNVTSFELLVFNRWGEVVFRTTDIHKGWDGTFQGRELDNGVYPWMIKYKVLNETEQKMLKGVVTLIR